MVHRKTIYLGLLLALFSCFLPLSYIHAAAIDVNQGTIGSVVTISWLPPNQTYIVQWDTVSAGSGTTPTTGIITFTVPESVGGAHTIAVQCPQGTQVYTSSFVVIPSIAISPESGTAGTAVSVTGKGFAATESTIALTYDSVSIKADIIAASNGSWTATVTVPNSAKGSHIVDAYGPTTTATSVTDKVFTIKPAISINPLNGGVGSNVTINGTGFAASESGINIIYDSKPAKSGITADSSGTWSTTFTVPRSASGNHIIDASGATTLPTDVPDINFAVSPGINIDKTSVSVGDTITIIGTGFGQYESSIFITFDGSDKGNSTNADDSGEWSIALVVPATVSGIHTINAHGNVTAVTSIANKTITVGAKITLSPTGGNVGDAIKVTGNGFGSTKNITVTYDSISVLTGITSDSTGSFSSSFKAPGGKSGEIKVIVTDTDNVSASSVFAMETTPPPLPRIVSPEKGNVVGFVGDTRINFKWTDVTDPSGVRYVVQLASDSNFQHILIEHADLTVSEYKSSDTEAVPHGEYYWRVRAIDGAGNASAWTAPTLLKAAFLPVTTFIIVLVFVLIIIPLTVLRLRVLLRRR